MNGEAAQQSPRDDEGAASDPPAGRDDLLEQVRILTLRLERTEAELAEFRAAAPPPPGATPAGQTDAEARRARIAGRPEPAAGSRAAKPPLPTERPRRRRGGLVWLLLLVVIAVGGWWLFGTDRGRDLLASYGLWGTPAETEVAEAPPSARPEPSGAPSAPPPAAPEAPTTTVPPPTAGTGVEPTVPPPAATPEPTEAGAPAVPVETAILPRPPEGTPAPAVEAAPVAEVEAAPLGDPAPLPPDSPGELRDLATQAKAGNAEAQHDLATVYALGQNVPQNYERAAYWYRQSADQGVDNAIYNLGVLTERGLGVQQNSAEAFRLFLQAAEAGHPDAQNAVGLAYSQGRGAAVDNVQAASWFQAASASGNPRGAYNLGRLFEQGLDGAPDLAAAAGWYKIAAEAGDAQARQALDRLTASSGMTAMITGEMPAPDGVPVPATTPEPVTPAGDTAAVTPGPQPVTRDEVREIQELLTRLDFEPGPADGLVGERTRSAIAAFQSSRDLTVTREPSSEVLTELRRAAAN